MNKSHFLSGLAALCLTATTAQAAFVLFEDFDADGDWTDSNNILSVVTDPIDGGGNNVGQLDGTTAGQFATKALGSGLSSGTVTFFYRTAINDTIGGNSVASTLIASNNDDNGFAGAGPLVTIKDGVDFTTRNGGSESTVASGLANLTWYNVWVVADLDSWAGDDAGDVEIYVSATDAVSGVMSAADFRWAKPSGGSLDSIELVRGGRFGDSAFYDDIYIDTTGENLSNPMIPEPGTLWLVGIAALPLLMFKRFRR